LKNDAYKEAAESKANEDYNLHVWGDVGIVN
jgi:hypothetical protein